MTVNVDEYQELRAVAVDAEATGSPNDEGNYTVAIEVTRELSRAEHGALIRSWGHVRLNGESVNLGSKDKLVFVSNTTIERVTRDYEKQLRKAIEAANQVGLRDWNEARRVEDERAAHVAHVKKVAEANFRP